MNLPPAILSIFVLSISFASEAVANPSRTLMYVNRSADGQQLILRRDGERLVIVDQRSYTVVASAPARETAHVTVRGADDRDDTLTLDLSTPFSLAGGIDYDGGAAGWDTLVITGGSVQKERVTQRTPHDGVVDLDGLVLRYTNLEPVTDLAAASSLTVNGTAGLDAVTISDGAVAGQATISSPTFESYTFSNKTNVVFDGLGGGDSVTINNPTTPTGLANLIIQNVATVGQTAPFNYPAFGVSATGTVNLPDVGNNVTNLGIVTVNGSITYRDVDDITIGGVSPAFIGLRVTNNGSISLVTGGTMTFPASTIESGDSSGDVFLQTFGAGSDITLVSGTVQAHAGSITEISGRDINSTALVLATDFITLTAMRDIALAGIDGVIADLAHTGANATATVGRDFITNATGFKRGSFGSELGTTTLNALAGSVILDDSPDYTLFGQNVNVTTDRLIMSTFSGGMLASGVVTISSASAPVDLGSTTDAAAALEISNVEINRISTPSIVVASSPGFGITVTQPMTLIQPHALTLRSAGTITSTGSGSLNVPTLAFDDVGTTARTWTVDASSVTMSPGAAIPYSGVTTLQANGGGASDTFNVTPAPTTVINIDGNLPTPPASPGDSLNVNTSGTTSPALGYASTASGFAGGYTFGNRAAVNFQEIETLLSTATDLGVTKTDGATTATAGNTVTYTIIASNPGPLGISGASVVDTFPAALSAVNWTCTTSPGSACNPAGSGGLNQLVNLAVGGTATFHVTATINPSATGSLSNSVTILPPAGTTDSNSSNNTATDTDTLTAVADLSVTKSSSQGSYTPGGTITYTIVLTNAGPSTASGVSLTDALPPNTTFASLSAPGGFSCLAPSAGVGGTVTCTIATLAPSTNTFTLVVNVNSSASALIVNTATVTATSADPNGSNNTSAASLIAVNMIPALSHATMMLLAAALAAAALLGLRRG